MADKINREVFKIKDQHNTIRFGAKFLGADGLEEKWSGEIPEIFDKGQLIGRIITNSEGKEYKVNKITEGNPEEEKHHQDFFWIKGI